MQEKFSQTSVASMHHQSVGEDTRDKIRAQGRTIFYHIQPDIAIIQGRTIHHKVYLSPELSTSHQQ